MKSFSQRTTPWNAEWSEEEIIHRFQTGIFLSQPMDTSFFDSTLEDCFGIIYLPELTSQPFRIISYSRQREVILDTLGDGKDLTSICFSMQNIHDDYIDRHKLDEGWHWLPYNAETIRKLYHASIQGSSTRDHEGILALNDELQREMPPGSWTEMYEVLPDRWRLRLSLIKQQYPLVNWVASQEEWKNVLTEWNSDVSPKDRDDFCRVFTLPSTVAEILKAEGAYQAQDGFRSQMELQGHVTLLNKGEEMDYYFSNFLPIVGRNGDENTLFVGHVFLPKRYWKLVRPTGPGLLRLSEQEEPSETIETYIKEKKAERKPKK